MMENRPLTAILALFILLGTTYAITTPVFEASDELWHYPMVRHLADGNPLPVQVFEPSQAGPWKQEASQPPLYYYLAAALTFWVDTSDMEQVRWLNPHVDNGRITADGNNNLVIHDPGANQWQGTLLAVHLVRLFSVLLGAATVYLTYRIANEVTPDRPELVLGATAVIAFTPMFLFISGAVNNDNLIIPLAAWALLLMIQPVANGRHSDMSQRPMTRHWLLLGVVIGSAALTKISGIGLLALAWGTLFITEWQKYRYTTPILLLRWLAMATLRWLLVLLPALLVAGWWYYRNILLYGDWKGWNAFIAVLGQRAHPASLAQLWGERWGFMLSYWGLFGGVNVPMATWIYHLLNGILILSLVGFIVYLFKELRYAEIGISANIRSIFYAVFSLVEQYFALTLCLLWSAAIVYGLINWATITWSSQGRLVFSALPTLTILMVLGLAGWLPPRLARWLVGALALFMFVVAALAPFAWIRPTYQPPPLPATFQQPTDINFGDKMRLVGYAVDKSAVQPGEAIGVSLEWEVLEPMARDWSVFVHLNDPVLGLPIAQRDMFPRQGLVATRLLLPGQHFVDAYRIPLPETAIAPADLELTVGLYDFYTGERLPIEAESADAITLASVALNAVPGEFPNPISVNFEHELELVGYELRPRRAQPGDSLALTLYWRGLRPLSQDYTFFAQVVAEDTTRWASHDLAPSRPTSAWPQGEVQTVELSLPLREDTLADVYPLIVGLYTRTDSGGFERLQVVTADGRLTDDFLVLTPVRVE